MSSQPPVVIETAVNTSIEKAWETFTLPEHIVNWAFANEDWNVPSAENDLTVGGKFRTVMAAKDDSMSFDFAGEYTDITEYENIEYDLGDSRHVKVQFIKLTDGVKVTQTFDPEADNSVEMQKDGWQSILNNYSKYTNSL